MLITRKSFYLLCLSFLFVLPSLTQAQFEIKENTDVKIKYEPVYSKAEATSKNCGVDTVAYLEDKLSGSTVRLLSIDPSSSAQAIAQYYDCPAPLTVYGFDFFAFSASGVVQTICEIYLAGPDSLPTGNALAQVTVPVDSVFGLGTLPDMRRKAIFTNPVQVTEPYIIIFRNPNPVNISLAFNDWDFNDGGGEWLMSGEFSSGGWSRGYQMNVNNDPVDADGLLHPYVEYDITAAFVADITCISGQGDSINFWNKSSDIIDNRMYNSAVAQGFGQASYQWDWGDLTPLAFNKDTFHNFVGTGPFEVKMKIAMGTWANATCNVEDTLNICMSCPPVNDFVYDVVGFKATFDNWSSGATTNNWDFGDGNTSTTKDPIHSYSANATYTVTLITSNGCGGDTITKPVTINCTDTQTVADFTWQQFFFLVNFNDTSQHADKWAWTFGDGNTSDLEDPSHTYTAAGQYPVRLIASNLCYADTTYDTVYAGPVYRDPSSGVSRMHVYPNPAQDLLNVDISLLGKEDVDIRLMDIRGRILEQASFQDAMRVKLSWMVSEYESGLYLVDVRTAQGSVIKKVSIRK